ncbi:MAG: hypothetical protein HY712_01775 [candidate division NC10 bacterium]|nr:hypothetical protein [candidate division NC10 bacterium]
MGRKRAGATKGKRPQPRRRRWLWPGILSLALLAGMIVWLLWPQRSPLADAPAYHGGPRLAVDRQEIDFGSVRFEKLVRARFRLKNVGDQPLRLAANPTVQVVEGC